MDLRPASHLTKEIPETAWEKLVLDSYPEYAISDQWEKFIRDCFKPRNSLKEWVAARTELRVVSQDDRLVGMIYDILGPFLDAFEAPCNILQSGDLEENQYNADYVNAILRNTLKVICSVDWRILEVGIESSKYRRNVALNPLIDRVLSAKRADGIARLWHSGEEVFVYEQTGPPNHDDITDFYAHDYRLVRTMRDILNQRIILRLKDGHEHNNLASFGSLGHRTDISFFWCTMHKKTYCLREYGGFKIPTCWQDLPALADGIITCLNFFSFMKGNIEMNKPCTKQQDRLLAKRKVHILVQTPATPQRPKKQKH